MSQELWATYAVNDHLAPRSLAADVLLFDRLVFPVPEIPVYPKGSGEWSQGKTKWARNPDEWKRWEANKWDPERQQRILKILRPVMRKQPWDKPHQDEWRTESARLAADGLPAYAFVATRTVLTRDLPDDVNGVAAVGPAYRTIEDIERELQIRDTRGRPRLPGGALATVLGWKFLRPSDRRLSDEDLLKETVEFVTGEGEFRTSRRAFIDWQQKFITDGSTSRESIDRAVKEMRELLEQHERTTRRLRIRKTLRYAFRIVPQMIGLGLAVAHIPGGIAGAAAGVFLCAGGIGIDESFMKDAEQGKPAPTAFVHHMRRHFGWKGR
jgi:hypothetical protein